MSKFLTFKLTKQVIALPILNIQEINDLMDITQVPKRPDFMLGVINLRGHHIPIFDFKHQKKEETCHTCIIIIHTQKYKQTLGFLADEVCEVICIDDKLHRSAINSDKLNAIIQNTQGIEYQVTLSDGNNIWMMDPNKLLTTKEADQIRQLL